METNRIPLTKKQQEVLKFIENFINQHGYSPSYREIMDGLNYESVSTVALHIRNLASRGHLRLKQGAARSIEPTTSLSLGEQWLVENIGDKFKEAESAAQLSSASIKQLSNLVDTLDTLGLQDAALEFSRRLRSLLH